jgi:hypothetical protein
MTAPRHLGCQIGGRPDQPHGGIGHGSAKGQPVSCTQASHRRPVLSGYSQLLDTTIPPRLTPPSPAPAGPHLSQRDSGAAPDHCVPHPDRAWHPVVRAFAVLSAAGLAQCGPHSSRTRRTVAVMSLVVQSEDGASHDGSASEDFFAESQHQMLPGITAAIADGG